MSATTGGRYTCEWCGTTSDGTALSCPGCGAPTDVQAVVAPSGWKEMPGIKDMARLEFGRSSCQIEGLYVPVADFNLAAGDGVYFTHHVLLWKDPQVAVTTMPMAGGWSRLLAGLPLVMTQATGPGHIAFSKDAPGETLALPLHPGQSVDVREHMLVAATANVAYEWFDPGVYFQTGGGKERETHYPLGMFMDRFTAAATPGLVVLHGAGNILVRRLEAGETILVRPAALLFKDPTVQAHLHVENPGRPWSTSTLSSQRYIWVRLYGPGRVAIQSGDKHFHDPGLSMTASSPLTRWRPYADSAGRLHPAKQWHYLERDRQQGPVRLDKVGGLAILGRLRRDVLVWTEGLKDWEPADTIGQCARCGAEVPYRKKRFANLPWTAILFFILCLPLLPFALLAWSTPSPVCGNCGADIELPFNPDTSPLFARTTTLRASMRRRR
jgi:uncharacterized protein (AIM24 family)